MIDSQLYASEVAEDDGFGMDGMGFVVDLELRRVARAGDGSRWGSWLLKCIWVKEGDIGEENGVVVSSVHIKEEERS